MEYKPTHIILRKYADVLVRFALNSGKGIRKDDVVLITANECAKPLFLELQKAVWRAGGHVISDYHPNNDEFHPEAERNFYTHAAKHQLEHFPKHQYAGLVKEIDHQIVILADTDMKALGSIDPKLIMRRTMALKPWREMRNIKENAGKYTWTIGLYGTSAMAKEAGMSLKEYWGEIINACFLDAPDPIAKWKKVYRDLETYRWKLNALDIAQLHVEGPDADLWIAMGKKRRWMGGSGRNIPSFELFTSPDWRGTEGWIRFNQPFYRHGNLVRGIELAFENGKAVKSSAKYNEKFLKDMIAAPNADKIGEFSLTDKRFSRITRFMAETLFDENMGGANGNTHIALGDSYQDCYEGDPTKVSKKEWAVLGYNDSAVHSDLISTAPRTVTAYLKGGKKKVIYKNGRYTV